MYKPLISCVVAIYNVDEYLDECIDSLRKQAYENIEIILVNDGSTDKCGEICEKHAKEDSRIIVETQVNQGANAARNNGLTLAKGDWVYFVDGDDYVKENVFTGIFEYIEKEPDIVLFSNYEYRGGNLTKRESTESSHYFGTPEDFFELSLATMNRFGDSLYNYKLLDSVSIWNKLYKTSFLKENSLTFVDKFPKTQDLSFNLLVYEKAKSAWFVDNPGYVYRINSMSVSKRFQEDFPAKVKVLNSWYNEYYKKHENERMKNAYLGRILTFSRTRVVLYSCNKQNKKSYSERRKEFLDYVEEYGINKTDLSLLKGLPLKEKVLSFFIVKRMFLMCELLTVANGILS